MQVDRSGLAVAGYKDKIYAFGDQYQGLKSLSINEILTPK